MPYHALEILRLMSIAIRTTAITDSAPRKIDAETRKILPDELSFPIAGKWLLELEDIANVGDNIVVGVGLSAIVATGVEVVAVSFVVGLGRGLEVGTGRKVGVGVGFDVQVHVTVAGMTLPPPL